jgi:gliding motility-associated-like protein
MKTDRINISPMAIRKNNNYLVWLLAMLLVFAGVDAQTVTFTSKNVTCNGGADGEITMTINGGSSSYRYVYYKTFMPSVSDSFGPTSNLSHTFSGFDPDYYTVFVRDVNTDNVLDFNTIQITQPAVLHATVTSANITCFGANNGTITISSPTGGSGAYEYSISGGASWQASGSFTGLAPGTYVVLIRDKNAPGCVITLNAGLVITQYAQLNATVSSTNVTCFGKSNGSIVISSPTGGSGTYQYSRNGGGSWQASGTFSPLAPGTYNVVMRDASVPTCTRTLDAALLITQPAQLQVTDITIIRGLTCNEGSDAQLQAQVTGGTAPYTYDWYVNTSGWVTINQHTQTATNLPKGWYEVRVNDFNNCGSPTPASAREVFLDGVPPADTIPKVFIFDSAGVVSTCQGQSNGSITIYVHAGVSPYRYSITAGGASGYQGSNTFAGLAAGAHQTWAMDKKGCKKSGPVKTVVTTPNAPVSVTIAANPSGSICPGTSVLFTATPVNGGTTPAYQWRLNGSNVGAGGPTYANSTLAGGDQVNAILTSGLRCTTGNPATSNTITASLLSPPAITAQPVNLTQCAGTNATFTVTASGSGITYQWKKNGSNIAGATNASYTINNIGAADAASYTVTVTGTCGAVTSNPATLTVNAAPAITAQPANVIQCAGTNATFTVTATGAGLTYQWRKGGVNIAGATSASYTIMNIAPADAANYDVVITGTCGSATSNPASLTVNAAPVITGQPVPLTQCTGTNATFTVTATGAGLAYQWRKNGVNITGATNASYTLNNIIPTDAANYDVVITGTCGSVTSNTAALVVNTAPAITTQPANLTQCAGTNATFTVTATGAGLTYQWRKNAVNIAGATNASYTINNIAPVDAASYTVVITGTCGSVTSNAATLTVNTAPAITTQPVSITQCTGTNATFSVTATGTGLTYQWRKNGVNIAGATNAVYTRNNIAPVDAAGYDVVITGTCGSVTSAIATLTVNTAPAITGQPVSLIQCAGTNATFMVTATGAGLTYQWRKNAVNIAGATNASYTINNIAPADAASYTVVITGTCGTVTSNAATLTVNTAPAITAQPASLAQCSGTNATFTVTSTGTGLTYQWRKNAVNIAGATNASYTINNIAPADAAGYDVVITGTCGSVTSAIATLTVNTAPAITGQPGSLIQCAGTNATFTVTATGNGLTYQWRKNAVNIAGATNASYTIINIAPADAASYTVVITGTCGSVTSAIATLTVNTAPAITTQPASLAQCAGTNATFTVISTGTGLTYQWRKNTVNIAGATNASYTINNIAPADAAGYDVVITGTCGAVSSNTATLTVNTAPAITLQPVSLTQCAGTNATFSATATGTGLTYQWKKNGINVGGATGTSYTINNIAPADAGNYTLLVTGTCGTVTSNVATLTVNTPPAIVSQPAPLTSCEGTTVIFTVNATGGGLSYQWRKNGLNIGGATGQSLTLSSITPSSAGNYDVVITGTCGSATSNAAMLTVAVKPQINAQPSDQEICEGSDVTFTVTASGTGLAYQWRRDGTNLPGQTSPVLTITAVPFVQAGNYDVLVYGLCDTLTSSTAVLTVDPATTILSSDGDTLVCEGSNVEFNITASGFGANTYQWQWLYAGSWIDLSDGGDISGVSTPDLKIQNVEAADSGYYRCFVSSGCGSVYSDSMNLDVNLIVATIGTPAPFLIDSTSTLIRVGVKVTDRFLNWDLGFALVAPDGTEVTLKAPLPFWCVLNPFVNGVDATFTNEIDRSTGDTLDYCVLSKPITGTFAATGNWNVLHGKDPANGAWQIRVYDSDKSVPDPDGFIKLATLTFTDLDIDGDTAVLRYNSGDINENILNPISGELRPTSYVVPIHLMTSCFNSEDARAVVTVKGGIPPYTYQWSGPTSVPNAAQVDLGAGNYTVTVIDALGCSSEASVEVTAPPAIVFDSVVHSDTIACFGSPEGFIRGKAHGGTGSIKYVLLPGNLPSAVADSGVFLNLTGGIYTLRATDINGCSLDTVITLQQRPELVVQIDSVPVTGTALGSITLSASGGTPPYQYSIDNGATLYSTGVFDSLAAGVYPVFVQDTNGCIFTQNVNLVVNELHVTVTKHDLSCHGATDGDFLLITVDGVAPYTLTGSWLVDPYISPDGLISFTGQTAGIYDLWITDSQGALFIDTVTLVEPAEILAVDSITNASCSSGTQDGAISLTVTGGTGIYSFAWNTGDTTRDLTSIGAGQYQVTISDENLCTATYDFDVSFTTDAHANAGMDDTICPGSEYQLMGNAADSVHWEPAALTDNPDIFNPTVTVMTSTPFYYTVYQNGCTDQDTVVISAYEHIGMDIYDPSNLVNIDTALYLLEGQTYTMAATPGFESYLWQPGTWLSDPTSEAVAVSPAESIYYTVFGTTSDGCVETDRVHVVIASKIVIFTGFSPNGDGINDTWVISHAVEYGDRIHVQVFNRWGEPVFESKGYGSSDQWDGTRNGKPMPVGAYYYIIEVDDGKSKPYTGTITILR